MSIPQKDQNILMMRARGVCSICRRELTVDASEHVPSGATILGEMAHIVGEKEDAARGKSPLSVDDRNRYPNLILLCREDHTIVDRDPMRYPVEVLHQIKADHEQWARSLLASEGRDAIDLVYTRRVNEVTNLLWLRRWDDVTNLVHEGILSAEFANDAQKVALSLQRLVPPGRHPDLDRALANVGPRVGAFLDIFLPSTHAMGASLRLDRSWKRVRLSESEYQGHMKREARWRRASLVALYNVTVAINEYAAAVRASIQPTYFLEEGLFCLYYYDPLSGDVQLTRADSYMDMPDDDA